MSSTGPDRLVLLEQKFDVITKEFNTVLGDIEKTVGVLTKGTAEALKSLARDISMLEQGLENTYTKLLEVEEKLNGITLDD